MTLAVRVEPPSRLSHPSFETMLQALAQPVLLIDGEGDIVWANAAAEEALGHGTGNIRQCFADFPLGAELARSPRVRLLSADDRSFECTLAQVDGEHVVVSLAPGAAQRATSAGDVDELTGMLRRNALLDAVGDALAEGGETQFALLCLDVDRFKLINDTLGHAVGDQLLKRAADRLRSACRATDLVARIGGDEFVVLQRKVTSTEDAERLAARIVDLVGRTYVLNGHTVNIGASVGIAFGGAGKQARDVLRDADLALYEAKRAGKGRYRLFENAMSETLRQRRELEIDLRRALALRQFELHYQPFVELDGDRIRGFEALLRWRHPVRGMVPPLEFIPTAEESGLIIKIGEWVLRTACDAAATWPGELTVAVNVSPLQFKAENLLETVRSALQHSGLNPQQLELEITEGALLDDTENVLTTLHAIRALGVKISMDDFGTGYSSLSYLQKFPFDKIKIDRSFVAGDDPDSRAILRAVASLGTGLGMAITAEGVETSEQLAHIREQRCTHVQGYLTGRPMAGGTILDFLHNR